MADLLKICSTIHVDGVSKTTSMFWNKFAQKTKHYQIHSMSNMLSLCHRLSPCISPHHWIGMKSTVIPPQKLPLIHLDFSVELGWIQHRSMGEKCWTVWTTHWLQLSPCNVQIDLCWRWKGTEHTGHHVDPCNKMEFCTADNNFKIALNFLWEMHTLLSESFPLVKRAIYIIISY